MNQVSVQRSYGRALLNIWTDRIFRFLITPEIDGTLSIDCFNLEKTTNFVV